MCHTSVLREVSAGKEGLDATDGPNVVLVLAPVDEGDEPGRVNALCAAIVPRLQPGVLQANGGRGPLGWAALQERAGEVLGCTADAPEVVLREAEVQPADVEAGLLQAFVQERRGSAKNDVADDPEAPDV